MYELLWADIRGLFALLSPDKQECFTSYLRSLTNIADNSTLQPFDFPKDSQNNA